MRTIFKFWLVVMVAGLVVGCAGRGPIVDHSEVYLKHAGDPVAQIRFERVRNWRPVGREHIVIDFSARGDYLIELGRECHSRLHANPRLRIDSHNPRVLDVTDRIIVDEVHRCRIREMRRVDMQAVRAELADVDKDVEEGEVEIPPEDGDQESGGT